MAGGSGVSWVFRRLADSSGSSDELECSETLNDLAAEMLEVAGRVVANAAALEQLFGGTKPRRRVSYSNLS